MKKITIKRGDTFDYSVAVTDDDGVAIDITSWTIRSQMRNKLEVKVVDFTCTITSASTGVWRWSYGAIGNLSDTSDWPIGTQYVDIEYTDTSGKIISTETMYVVVEKDVTYTDA